MIFKIEQEKNLFHLFWKDTFLRTVSSVVIKKRSLQLVSCGPEEICEELDRLEKKGLLRYAIFLLSRQSLHSNQLISKLANHTWSRSILDEVVSHCRKEGWIDDKAWEQRKVYLWSEAGKSRREIAGKLRGYGISSSALEGVDDREILKKILSQEKMRSLLQSKEGKEKVIKRLIRRGFSFSLIKEFILN